MAQVINFAHRGASAYCPENTMAAFEKALELGATGIETDIQMTKDGQLLLIHDESLARTTGVNQFVKDLSLEEIKDKDAGSWFHPDFKNERIPTLEELLDLVKHTDTIINLELKSGMILYPGIEKMVVETVRKYEMEERVIISSFNHYSLVEVKQIAPEMKTAVLYSEALYEPWHYAKQLGASSLHPFYPAARPEFVAEAKNYGIDYNPYTVNETGDMEVLIAAGVNGIITNYPDRLASLIKEGWKER
jgi:glycerophosphoryl diester phosphodiesterase